MCGIVGIIGKKKAFDIPIKCREMFKQMLFINTLRGDDSTGVFGINKYSNVHFAKEAVAAPAFLEEKQADDIMKELGWDMVAMVGHNRKATKGTIKDDNAHPFVEENIILVHNGTLLNHKELNKEVEVDSHAVAHVIKEHGVYEAISKIEGAFAIAAYDIDQKQLHLFRNKERPLFLMENEDVYVFASEPWMMLGTAWRNAASFKEYKEIPAGEVFTFTFEFEKTTLTTKEVPLHEKKSFPVVIHTTSGKTRTTIEKEEVKKFSKKLSSHDFAVRWKKGDIINFKPLHSEISSTGYPVISGTHFWFPDVTVKCFLSKSYTAEDIYILMQQEELVADVASIFLNSTNNTKNLYCSDASESAPLVSDNGIVVNEEMTLAVSHCKQCNVELQEEDIIDSWIKITQGGTVSCVCLACVENNRVRNPKWGMK